VQQSYDLKSIVDPNHEKRTLRSRMTSLSFSGLTESRSLLLLRLRSGSLSSRRLDSRGLLSLSSSLLLSVTSMYEQEIVVKEPCELVDDCVC
jgi:hypothetical protein